jgi:hypothetical protein
LTRYVAETLADLFTVEWALTDLRLERGVLESEEALKPILHALLISGTLPSLSLAGNKKIKAAGWRLVSVFLKQVRLLLEEDLANARLAHCVIWISLKRPGTARASSTWSNLSTRRAKVHRKARAMETATPRTVSTIIARSSLPRRSSRIPTTCPHAWRRSGWTTALGGQEVLRHWHKASARPT